MTAPTAAAAMATVMVETENRSGIMVSFCLALRVTGTDPVQRRRNPWRCLLSPGENLVPPQRRGLHGVPPASWTGTRSFLQRSEARNKFDLPGLSVWLTLA